MPYHLRYQELAPISPPSVSILPTLSNSRPSCRCQSPSQTKRVAVHEKAECSRGRCHPLFLRECIRLFAFKETLELRKDKLGPEHPDTLQTMDNLAIAYLKANQPEKELPLFDRFIAGRRGRATQDDPMPSSTDCASRRS